MADTNPDRLENIRVGVAGWSLSKEHADRFPAEGTHLERYAARFPAVKINASFYKPHRPTTYARWAESVPEGFRFSVKVPERFDGDVALDSRHASWFTHEAERLVTQFRVARVAADRTVVPSAAEPGGWDGLVYYRLHGSPKVYYSAYPDNYLVALAKTLTDAARSAEVWCIFDNTAAFAATLNALDVLARIGPSPS